RWLPELAPPGSVPSLVFEDPLNHLLAMQAVPQPHENWKTLLLAGHVEPDHVRQFGELLAAVHRRSVDRADELRPVFADRCYFESLRLEPYYAYTATQVPEAADFLAALSSDTTARALCVVHGDYSPKNVLVHAGRLVLLDHEVIHWGDPAFDVGFAMAHFLGKAHHLAEHRAAFVDAAKLYWRTYFKGVGGAAFDAALEPMSVRHSLGCSLARVAGRSPLEYLGAEERERQRMAVVALMRDPPATVEGMIDGFAAAVGR
ncbi:MAG TPA: phosphotransferase, partial [Humisphaera sp.]